jgi:hypothetical protein
MDGTWRSHAPEADRRPGRETATFPFTLRSVYKAILLLCLSGCAHSRQNDAFVHETARRPLFHPTDEQISRRRDFARDVAVAGLYGAVVAAYIVR